MSIINSSETTTTNEDPSSSVIIPDYILSSKQYLNHPITSMNEAPEPYRPPPRINNIQDCIKFLHCHEYWGMEGIPSVLMSYLFDRENLKKVMKYVNEKMLEEKKGMGWQILKDVEELNKMKNFNSLLCEWSAWKGYLDCLKVAHEQGCDLNGLDDDVREWFLFLFHSCDLYDTSTCDNIIFRDGQH